MTGRVNTAIRFDPDVYDRLKAESDRLGLPINWIENRLLRESFERLADEPLRLTR